MDCDPPKFSLMCMEVGLATLPHSYSSMWSAVRKLALKKHIRLSTACIYEKCTYDHAECPFFSSESGDTA